MMMQSAFWGIALILCLTCNAEPQSNQAPANTTLISEKMDLLIVQHPKWISLYSLKDLRFRKYLPLEGHPLRVWLDESSKRIYVQLAGEIDNIAIFENEILSGWIHASNRTYRGDKIDPSSLIVESGMVHFFDSKSRTKFALEETTYIGRDALPSSLPEGVIGSPDILVNTTVDEGPQTIPNVEFDVSGNFVITWTDEEGNDGSGQGVYVREFNADTSPALTEFLVNKTKSGDQGTSSIHVDQNGDYTIIWRDGNETDGDADGVYARMFAKGGQPKTDFDILVPNTTEGRQMAPSITGDPSGNWIAAWSGPDDGDGRGIWMRRFDPLGNPIANEVRANPTFTDGHTWAVDVHANHTGHFVVVWRDDSSDRIRGRAYFSDGSSVSATEFTAGPLNSQSSNFEPSVSVFEDGSFIVVWRENSAGGIVAQKFNADQSEADDPFVVTSEATGAQYAPYVAVAPDNSFVVVWRDSGYNNDEIVARMFDSNGIPIGDDFIVPENSGNDEFECNVAVDNAGNFVVAWKDRDGPTSIAARHFTVGPGTSPLTVTGVNPDSADRGDTLTVGITGTNFASDASVNFNDSAIITNSVNFIDPENLDVSITVGASAFLGLHDVTVTVGPEDATGEDLFKVLVNGEYPSPLVFSANPPAGNQGQILTIEISGNDFANDVGLLVDLGSDISVNQIDFISGTTIRVDITISSSAVIGLRDITVTNPGGNTGTCVGCFEVLFNPSLFVDNFDDQDISDWVIEKDSWDADSMQLHGESSGKAKIISPFSGCAICAVEIDMMQDSTQGGPLTLFFWYVDVDNYVKVEMNKGKGRWYLKQVVDGDVIVNANAIASIQSGIFYHTILRFDGTNFILTVDGVDVITVQAGQAPFSNGTLALNVKDAVGVFDNLLILP